VGNPHRWSVSLAGSVLVAASIINILASVSIAAKPRYVPPKTISAPTRTLGGGSRGCYQQVTTHFRLLAPSDHVGVTALGRPTFAWQMASASAVPMQLALVEVGVSAPLWVTTLPKTQAGLNQITVPDHVQELQPERRYRWTLSLICNPKRPSQNAYATAWIERIALTSEQQASLKASPKQERANVLAQNGIWYDGLASLIDNPVGFASALEAAEHLLNQAETAKVPLPGDA
jgi:hypothetical protein